MNYFCSDCFLSGSNADVHNIFDLWHGICFKILRTSCHVCCSNNQFYVETLDRSPECFAAPSKALQSCLLVGSDELILNLWSDITHNVGGLVSYCDSLNWLCSGWNDWSLRVSALAPPLTACSALELCWSSTVKLLAVFTSHPILLFNETCC